MESVDEITIDDQAPNGELNYTQSLQLLYQATQLKKARAATHARFQQAFEKLAILVRQDEARETRKPKVITSPAVKDS